MMRRSLLLVSAVTLFSLMAASPALAKTHQARGMAPVLPKGAHLIAKAQMVGHRLTRGAHAAGTSEASYNCGWAYYIQNGYSFMIQLISYWGPIGTGWWEAVPDSWGTASIGTTGTANGNSGSYYSTGWRSFTFVGLFPFASHADGYVYTPGGFCGFYLVAGWS
jgi:hypothetical protein